LTELLNNNDGNNNFAKMTKTAIEYSEYLNSNYFQEYICIVKSRDFLPYSGFRAFEVDNWYTEKDTNGKFSLMKGFVRQADPKKDLVSFFIGKKYTNVIFFPHEDNKMKNKNTHDHENLLM